MKVINPPFRADNAWPGYEAAYLQCHLVNEMTTPEKDDVIQLYILKWIQQIEMKDTNSHWQRTWSCVPLTAAWAPTNVHDKLAEKDTASQRVTECQSSTSVVDVETAVDWGAFFHFMVHWMCPSCMRELRLQTNHLNRMQGLIILTDKAGEQQQRVSFLKTSARLGETRHDLFFETHKNKEF